MRQMTEDYTNQPCSICGVAIGDRFGNNAQPVNAGRCCSMCNTTVVIPVRLAGSRKNFLRRGE